MALKIVRDICTACGDCFSVCPDSAIPGLVNSFGEVFESATQRIERDGRPTQHLRRETRKVEKRLRALIEPVAVACHDVPARSASDARSTARGCCSSSPSRRSSRRSSRSTVLRGMPA